MKIALLLTTMICSLSALAQRTNNKAFGLMIDALISESVPVITCEELKHTPQAIRLDARQQKEYAVSHLPNARWIGYDEFDLKRIADLPKDTPIVVYCSVGYRSEKIGEKLKTAGYANVKNLYGSLFEWVNEGNPVVDSTGKVTPRVHAYSRAWGIWLRRGIKIYE